MLLLAGTVLIIVLIAAFVAIDHAANRERSRARVSMELGDQLASPVDRGAYVARAADCMACHTAPGQRPYAGGLVMNVGFGTLSSPNITPDAKTGIGGWTKEQFRLAVREGIRPDGSQLYPAMPFPSYARMSDADVDALYAYFMSLSPVAAPRVKAGLYFPFNIRALMLGWKALFFDNAEFQPKADRTAQINRGAYLVEGPAHCGECHSPRNAFGAIRSGKLLSGAAIDGFYAPNLTPDRETGLGSWTQADIAAFLTGGPNAHGNAFGPMRDAVVNGTAWLTDADRQAMAAYLAQVPAIRSAVPARLARSDMDASLDRGRALYADNCSACHRISGHGTQDVAPALAGQGALNIRGGAANVIAPILGGLSGPGGGVSMPAFTFDDQEVADIVNYTRKEWGGLPPDTTAATIAKARGAIK